MGVIEERIEMQWLAGINWKCATFETESHYVHIYFYSSMTSRTPLFSSESRLLNESKHQTMGSGTSVLFHRDHTGLNDPNKDHLHFMQKNKKLFAVNRDGSGHDGNHGLRIPNEAYKYIKNHYPDFLVRDDQFIESLEVEYPTTAADLKYLLERQNRA